MKEILKQKGLTQNDLSRPILSQNGLKKPVKQGQVVKAVKEWMVRFNQRKTPEEGALLSAMYYEDLLFKDVSEKEFEILKREVNATCQFFPSVAEILMARHVFYDGVFEPNAADKRAAAIDPSYSCGARTLLENVRMSQRIEADFGQERLSVPQFGRLLKGM